MTTKPILSLQKTISPIYAVPNWETTGKESHEVQTWPSVPFQGCLILQWYVNIAEAVQKQGGHVTDTQLIPYGLLACI